MKPTRVPVLVALGVLAGALTWVLTRAYYAHLPPLPGYSPVSVFLLALAEGYWARVVRARVTRRGGGRPLHPITVARAAALAKASSLVGTLAAGGYAGFLAYVLGELSHSASRSRDAAVAAAGLACSCVLVAAALGLERACRVPDGDDDERDDPGPDDGWG